MPHFAAMSLVAASIAAVFGFSDIAAGTAGPAQLVFVVFAVLTVVSILDSLLPQD